MEEECSRTFGTTELGILRTASWMRPVQKYSNPSVATFRKHPRGRFLIVFSRMVHKKNGTLEVMQICLIWANWFGTSSIC